nr:NAD(P)H-hydrate dehydratase [Kordiimonas laminariae]
MVHCPRFQGGTNTVIQSPHDHILLTPAEAREADEWAIQNGTSGWSLMEAAGRAAADILVEYIGTPIEAGGEILILCGPGNNGGDGFVIARHLDDWGYPVKVALSCAETNLKGDAAVALKRWEGPTISMASVDCSKASVIVDALFGTGQDRPLEGAVVDVIETANTVDAFRFAIDVPSGLNAENGIPFGLCFSADATVTFSSKKPGHMIAPGRFLCGGVDNVHVADIGIGKAVYDSIDSNHFANEPGLWSACYPCMGPATHKYDRGHLLVLGGREPTLGASRLASISALRAGAGLVTLAAPSETYSIQASVLTDVMVRRFDSVFGFVGVMSDARITTVLLGPGAGVGEKTIELIQHAGEKERHMVLDADALTSLQGRAEILADYDCQKVLTPHDGEFARLFPDLDIMVDRIAAVRAASKRINAVVVLKGVSTLIAAPDGRVAITSNAPAYLSVGGTGDVLSGIIASLVVQGMPAFEAAAAGVWIHGEAANKAGRGMIASDLLKFLSAALP